MKASIPRVLSISSTLLATTLVMGCTAFTGDDRDPFVSGNWVVTDSAFTGLHFVEGVTFAISKKDSGLVLSLPQATRSAFPAFSGLPESMPLVRLKSEGQTIYCASNVAIGGHSTQGELGIAHDTPGHVIAFRYDTQNNRLSIDVDHAPKPCAKAGAADPDFGLETPVNVDSDLSPDFTNSPPEPQFHRGRAHAEN